MRKNILINPTIKFKNPLTLIIMKMKLKNVLILLLFIAISQQITAQNKSIKIYSNFMRPLQKPALFDNDGGIKFRGLSVAYRIWNGEFSQEVEARFNARNKSEQSNTFNSWEGHLRYEIGKFWNISDRFIIQRGLSATLYHLNEDINVEAVNVFPLTRMISGIEVGGLIHFIYEFKNNIYLDLNTSVLSASLGTQFSEIENPMLTERERRQGGYDFDILFFGNIRIGVGYIFNSKKENNN